MQKSILTIIFYCLIMFSLPSKLLWADLDDTNINSKSNEGNIYSARKSYLLRPLLDAFEKDTNIKVNIISGKAKVLQKRIEQEGKNTRADVLLTVDAGNLYEAKKKNLLKKINSKKLNMLVPKNLRDDDGFWYGLSIRSRVIMFNPLSVNVKDLSTYEGLAHKKWKGKICSRPGSHVYNRGIMASVLAALGEEESENWAKGMVANFGK